MTIFTQDVRYALRLAQKNPVFTLVAIISLALGIGVNTVLFSIVYGVLLRPLPYAEPDRLMRLVHGAEETYVSIPEFEFWKEHSTVFDSVAAYRGGSDQSLVFGNTAQRLSTSTVTTDFFRTLGVAPLYGREFNSEETRVDGPKTVILTHGLWKLAFNSDPGILGRDVTLDDTPYTVVGILPAGFWFPQKADVFLPLRVTGGITDTGTNTDMIARLRQGVSLRQAATATASLADEFRQVSRLPHPLGSEYRGLTPVPYQQWLTGSVRVVLLLIFGAVAVLLLVACSNLASLLLARLASRQREVAVRLALGSSRIRMVRHFLIENILISLTGGLAAVLCAMWLLPALLAWIPFELPAAAPIALDMPVLAFTLAVAVGAGVMLSLAPCMTSAHLDIHEALKMGARMSAHAGTRQRLRSALVIGQVALSVVLSIAAALLSQSLYRLSHEQLGYDPNGLLTFRLATSAARRVNSAELRSFESALPERLRSIPGIRSVAAANVLPLQGQNNFPTQRDGHPEQSIGGMEIRIVTPAFFETMGIPIRQGRPFSDKDDGSSAQVIAVNETVARRWWGTENPIGGRVVIGRFQGRVVPEGGTPDAVREVVAVIGNTKSVFLKERPRPTVYIPVGQSAAFSPGLNWVVRGDFSAVFPEQLQRAVSDVDPRLQVDRLGPMEALVASMTADSRFDALAFGAFAAIALLLSAIGVFGLLSFSVAQRSQEIGTRLALGASRSNVLMLILRQGFTLTAAGLILGLVAAFALTRFLSSLLFGVRTTDPLSFAMASAVLIGVGLLASYIPARYATKVDPMTSMRSE
jgi:putative ABC transport system permease protein